MKLYKRDGTKVWWMRATVNGKQVRRSTGEVDEGQAWVAAARLLIEEAPAPVMTCQGLLDAWSGTLDLGQRGRRDDVSRAQAFVDHIGADTPCASVTVPDVSRWVSSMDSKSAATANRYRCSASCMFRWGLQLGHVTVNPVVGSYRPAEDTTKKEALTEAEVADVLKRAAVAGPALEATYQLAFFSGMRLGEIARARWEDVSLEAGTIKVRGTKTEGSEAVLPLHPRLREYLVSCWRDHGPIVSNAYGRSYHPDSLTKMRTNAGLPGFHRARHTLATSLVRAGVDIYHVRELLRHSSVKTTERFYAHAAPSRRSDELSRFMA